MGAALRGVFCAPGASPIPFAVLLYHRRIRQCRNCGGKKRHVLAFTHMGVIGVLSVAVSVTQAVLLRVAAPSTMAHAGVLHKALSATLFVGSSVVPAPRRSGVGVWRLLANFAFRGTSGLHVMCCIRDLRGTSGFSGLLWLCGCRGSGFVDSLFLGALSALCWSTLESDAFSTL